MDVTIDDVVVGAAASISVDVVIGVNIDVAAGDVDVIVSSRAEWLWH
jgi:hypothetical protein